jgi:RNA polymerase sigma factor (sigma-70 family)
MSFVQELNRWRGFIIHSITKTFRFDKDKMDDVVQDAMLRIIKNAHLYDPKKCNIEKFIEKQSHYAVLDVFRRARRSNIDAEPLTEIHRTTIKADAPPPWTDIDKDEFEAELKLKMPLTYKNLVEGKKMKDIGRNMGLSEARISQLAKEERERNKGNFND